ncbi:LacI family DNA-binding transcriptional regulator [Tissierella praeacuta]|uniref:LacI family DNA-binding transcriptional regulator n=1 Tax=Tissierella praeacuta TaxID=43131 RepID=UPI002FD9045D
MATIKDIAIKTNLSTTTVSLVLNNRADNIPQKTKDIVLKAARDLNYSPNQLAVALVTKRSKTLGLIVPDIRNDFFSNLAKGIEDECRNKGWTVFLCNSNDMHDRDLEYIKILAGKGVDGILYCMSSDSDAKKFKEKYELFQRFGIKFIALDRYFDFPNIITARLDHLKGGYLATKHLIDLGHRRIACLTGPNNLIDSNERLKGYKMALKENGIPYDPNIIIEGNYQVEGGLSAVDKLVKTDFTAIFAFNDMMAYGLFKGLQTHGLFVPKDISIVGYDDIYLSEILEVPLTTVHQPVELMGKTATNYLINLIENEVENNVIPTHAPKLVVRKSTAKLNSS